MTHPSIQGLREAAGFTAVRCGECGYLEGGTPQAGCCRLCGKASEPLVVECFEADRLAAYLTEHGVGWFGEGLVRAEGHSGRHCAVPTTGFHGEESVCARLDGHEDEHYIYASSTPSDLLYRLVPVPQDGGT